jgi:deoxyribonuclease-1
MWRLAVLLVTLPSLAFSGPETFSQAKRALAEIYADHTTTFYCGCTFDHKRIDAASCGLTPRKQPARAARLEWEHVVPAHELGGNLPCWQEGGRKACRSDPLFNQMESDLHNLVPAVGELNGDRSNFRFGEVPGEPREYGACNFEVDFATDTAEPPENVRGDIARVYFYMTTRYDLKVSQDQLLVFVRWSVEDPEDDWEREKRRRIEALQ